MKNEWVLNPIKVIKSHFEEIIEENKGDIKQLQGILEGNWGIPEKLKQELSLDTYSNLLLIPSINSVESKEGLESLKGKLVRYDCMIQNILDTEFALTVLNGKKDDPRKYICTKYEDSLGEMIEGEIGDIHEKCLLVDRQRYVLEAVKYKTEWMKEIEGSGGGYQSNLRCVGRVYEDNKGLLLNEIITVVGVLSLPQEIGEEEVKECDMGDMGIGDSEIVSRTKVKLPHIEVLLGIGNRYLLHYNRILNGVGYSGILEQLSSQPEESATYLNELRSRMEEGRRATTYLLESLLGGDKLAAQYLLLSLLGHTHTREGGTTAIGLLPLNLTNTLREHIHPQLGELSSIPETISHFLELICSKMLYLPLKLSMLNSTRFAPMKNYETEELESGVLQMSFGTVLLVDETQMGEGELGELGVKNIKHLMDIISMQSLMYDFKYSQIAYHTDSPVIICSQGKSMLKGGSNLFHLPLLAQYTKSIDIQPTLSLCTPPQLQLIREYICIMAHPAIIFNIPQHIIDRVQTDFLTERKAGGKISGDDMHSWLVVARLIALSKGRAVMELDDYLHARQIEALRLSRLH